MSRRSSDWFRIYWDSINCFFHEQYTYRASALAFTTLLALVPLSAVIVFFISTFPIFTHIILLAENYILNNFVPTSTTTIQFYFDNFVQQTTKLPTLSLIFLFITAMLLLDTIEETLNAMWKIPKRRRRFFSIFVYWGVLLFTPVILGLSVFITSYFLSLTWISKTTGALGLTAPLLTVVPVFTNTLLFSLLYVVLPNARVDWQAVFMGGFTAAILLELAHYGFVFYFQQYPSYEVIYGAFAAIPIFLLWLYTFWFAVLFGALVTHTKTVYDQDVNEDI